MIGELYGVGSAAAWAMTSIVMKALATKMNAAVVNGLRCAISLVFFLAVLLALGRGGELWQLPFPPPGYLILSGLIGVGICDVFYIWSMRLIGAARAMPIAGSYPMVTLLLAAIFLGEKITPLIVLGTALVIVGVTMLIVPAGMGWRSMGRLLYGAERKGLLLALLTACGWAFASTILKAGLQDVDALMATIVRLATAAASLLLIARVVERHSLDLGSVDRRGLAGLLFISAVGSVGTFLFVLAVQHAGAAKAAALNSTAPLFALPLAVYLGEGISKHTVVGTVLAVVGIWCLVS